jgi:two-component system chemotaxis response regulator CheY
MTALEDAYKTLKVLVIEDEPGMRQVICRLVEQLGVTQIGAAADGDSGYDEVLKMRPDVVLCDVHMQKGSGQAFLERVRGAGEEWLRVLPIVLLSGDSGIDTVRIAHQHHADGYMVKPLRREDIKTQIDRIITRLADRAPAKPIGG